MIKSSQKKIVFLIWSKIVRDQAFEINLIHSYLHCTKKVPRLRRDGTNGNLQDFRFTDRIKSLRSNQIEDRIESKNDRIE